MKRISRKSGIPRDTGITPLHSNEKGKALITFSLKYTAINIGVSVLGFPVYAVLFYTLHITDFTDETPDFILIILRIVGLPSIPGLLLTLAATFSNQCNCCKSCSCCGEPFEFGALLTSSPLSPCILGSDGQVWGVEGDRGLEEEMENMAVEEVEVKNIEAAGRVGLSCVPVFF